MTSTSIRGPAVRSPVVRTHREPDLRTAFVLSAIVAGASIVASLGGLLIQGLYQDDSAWATAALRGGDLATLVIAVPTLIAAISLSARGSTRARLVWIGMLAYAMYNFAFYVFGAAFNDLFLVHVVAFSSSILALVTTLPHIDATGIARRFSHRTPVRLVGGLLFVVGVVFAALWSVFSLKYAVTGQLSLGSATLPGMHLVFAIDLSLMVPSMVLAGVLLWRRRPWGLVLGTAMSVFGAAYQFNLALAGWFQADAGVAGAKRIDPIGVAFIVAFLAASLLMLRGVDRDVGAKVSLLAIGDNDNTRE